MEKKIEDEELDKLIEEQFIKEAKIMEEALFSEDDSKEYQPSDEEIKASYQKLVERLKADGIYREDDSDEDDVEAETEEEPDMAEEMEMPSGSDISDEAVKVVSVSKHGKTDFSGKFAKVAGFVVVSAMCVFAASMTSEANRDYFVKHVGVFLGDDTRVIIDNDENNEIANSDEYKARDDIEEKLGIDVPRFYYRPDTFEFYNYEVDQYAQFARVEYKYGNTIVEFGMDKVSEATTSKFDSIHGEELETVKIESEDINVIIRKIQDDQDLLPSYLAQWKKEDAIYYIFGKIDLEELNKMINLINY